MNNNEKVLNSYNKSGSILTLNNNNKKKLAKKGVSFLNSAKMSNSSSDFRSLKESAEKKNGLKPALKLRKSVSMKSSSFRGYNKSSTLASNNKLVSFKMPIEEVMVIYSNYKEIHLKLIKNQEEDTKKKANPKESKVSKAQCNCSCNIF